MTLKPRVAFGYTAAVLIPLMLGSLWSLLSPVVQLLPALLFLLFASLIARFSGFGPALVYIAGSAVVLALHVFRYVAHEPTPIVLRLVLYLVVSITIASISRRRSEEVREAEERLDASRRRLQALFDTALDAILFFGSDGRFVDANPGVTRLLGYTHEEIMEKNVGDFTQPQHRDRTLASFHTTLTTGESTGELRLQRKDGTDCDVEFRSVANVLPDLHVVMMHDISERKEAARALEQLPGRLLRTQDEERRRIARQLHDTTAQNLAAIRLNLVALSRTAAAEVSELLTESIALTEESMSEIRTLAYLLHPPLIEEAGLVATLRWFVRGFETRSGIAVCLDVPDVLQRLPPETETTLFRIIQESLTNIQRHSHSSVARIRLNTDRQRIQLEIVDEGTGIAAHFRGNEAALFASGVGVAGMRQRARDLGGEMKIESNDGGTRVTVVLPLEKSE
jgi:PAS domain S-box-containing protein